MNTHRPHAASAASLPLKVEIIHDLYDALSRGRMSLADVTWVQHQYHEKRRWSVSELLADIPADLCEADRVFAWNAGRAELTTKPGADRLTRQADAECRRWQGVDDTLSAVMQACSTWSRYWNEEESHHETAFGVLAQRAGMPPIDNATFIEYRKVFPDDDMLRTLFLLAISEINALCSYASGAARAANPTLRTLLKQAAADESQHMRYFLSFAKALVDSGKYPAKGAFAIAHMFLREGGELYGSTRDRVEERGTHVNWWDHLEGGPVDMLEDIEQKRKLVFSALRDVTGINVHSVEAVEDTWMELAGV